ncbi:hypothetical protein BEP68_17835 [Microbacterium sp. 4-7]|nr:hypothetical protein [Microbacterium sp. 4-7]
MAVVPGTAAVHFMTAVVLKAVVILVAAAVAGMIQFVVSTLRAGRGVSVRGPMGRLVRGGRGCVIVHVRLRHETSSWGSRPCDGPVLWNG